MTCKITLGCFPAARNPFLPWNLAAAVSVIIYQRGEQSFLWVAFLHVELESSPETFGNLYFPQEIDFGLLPCLNPSLWNMEREG